MSKLIEALRVEHPYYCAKIREGIPELQRYSDLEIETLWDQYSDDYAAGWLIVDEEEIEKFRNWLL